MAVCGCFRSQSPPVKAAVSSANVVMPISILFSAARAVVTNPKLILADEPTGNLDSKNGAEVMNLLTELNKEGTSIVMVTHSQHDAGFAHRVIHLFDGSVVANIKE